MAEQVNFTWNVDDQGVIDASNRMLEKINEQQQGLDVLGESASKSFNDIAKSVNSAEKELADTVKRQMDYNEQVAEQEKNTKRFNDIMKQHVRELRLFGVSVGDVIDRLKSWRNGLVGVQRGLRGTGAGLRALRVALISTGIGAIVVLVGSLIAAFSRLQPIMDKVRVATAGISAAVDVLGDRLATIGGAIIGLVAGQKSLSEAWEEGRGAVSGLNEELREEIRLAQELERAQIDLERATTLLNTRMALQRAQIRELDQIARDQTKSTRERAQAAREAFDIENGVLREREALLRRTAALELVNTEVSENEALQQLDAIIERTREGTQSFEELRDSLGLSFSSDEDARNFFGVIQEIGTFQEQSLFRQTRLNSTLNTIQQEAIRQAEQRRQAIQELIDQVADAEATLGGAGAEAARQFELATRAIEEMKREARSLGLEIDFGPLEQLAAAQFGRAVDAAKGELQELPSIAQEISNRIVEPLTAAADRGEAEALRIVQGLQAAVEQNQPLLLRIKDTLLRTFNLSEEEFQTITGQFGNLFSAVFEGLEANAEAAIAHQQRVVQALDRRINETSRLLDIERDRQEQGFANDVRSLEEKLAQEQQAREEAERRRLELEKRAAKQRLIQNSLEQASNFVLAATKLAAAEAGKGVIGIFTALSGLALLLRLITQAKSISTQFAEVPQFREGTPFVDGPGTATSDSIPARLSRGERVVDAATNLELGGRNLTNEELIQTFRIGRKAQEYLTGSGTGFPAMPYTLPLILKGIREDREAAQSLEIERHTVAMEKAYREASDRAADRMIEYWKSRPITKPTAEGETTEWFEGRTLKKVSIKKSKQ